MISALRLALLLAVAGVVAGSAGANANQLWRSAVPPPLQGPVVIGAGGPTGLEYWPASPNGGLKPTPIHGPSGLKGAYGIAADGQRLAIADSTQTIVYDLLTQHEAILPDSTGVAIDAAYGKTGTLYVASFNNQKTTGDVLVYPRGAKPYTLECSLLKIPDYIAVDNEGNVFVNDGYLTEVIEIPVKGGCAPVKLKPAESGYAAGVTVDPKTDDLLVLSDPDLCAGGNEGKLTIYHKPYDKVAGRSMVLGRNCSGGVRLNADSSVVLIGDEGVAGPPSFILQHTYPEGKQRGGYFGPGAGPAGFTTIPNSLPN